MGINCSTLAETKEQMLKKLSRVVPEIEIPYKAELVFKINQLKKEKNVVILGHNYMEPALFHTIPDIVGDSLQLSREAAKTTADIIIFCGVRFMAETAKILNPNKTVLLPTRGKAGCSLAAAITAQDVRDLRVAYPGLPIVAYVNTYADVKAEIDYCCTSGNAVKLVQSLGDQAIIFLPDEYLAKNVAEELGRKVAIASPHNYPELKDGVSIIGWKGCCEVHDKFTVEDIQIARKQYPDVVVITHPESRPEVVAASDFSGSTSVMNSYVKNSPASRFLILTECSMGDNIIADNPDKEALRMCHVRCPHMNQITLEDTLYALEHNKTVITIPEDIRIRALRSVERMLAIG